MAWKFMLASAVLAVARTMPNVFRKPSGPALISDNALEMALSPAPINPDWVLQGNPQARSCEQSASADCAAYTAIWDCTAGTFRWYFGWDETVYILEGEVHVTDADGGTRTLRAGDVAYFRGGTWAIWKIDTYLKKVAFMRRTLPAPASFVYRAGDAARRRLGGRKGGALH
ncbi:cupin domain-containing protein [Ochrobactrum sp. CM-21-5]|nr:cupin domain-containing protein [Ochrobactrum sp. CM-21-5]MBC2885371.1 cupin domain-containing protein [Ochrobactrum sp. CM-21-5]